MWIQRTTCVAYQSLGFNFAVAKEIISAAHSIDYTGFYRDMNATVRVRVYMYLSYVCTSYHNKLELHRICGQDHHEEALFFTLDDVWSGWLLQCGTLATTPLRRRRVRRVQSFGTNSIQFCVAKG